MWSHSSLSSYAFIRERVFIFLSNTKPSTLFRNVETWWRVTSWRLTLSVAHPPARDLPLSSPTFLPWSKFRLFEQRSLYDRIKINDTKSFALCSTIYFDKNLAAKKKEFSLGRNFRRVERMLALALGTTVCGVNVRCQVKCTRCFRAAGAGPRRGHPLSPLHCYVTILPLLYIFYVYIYTYYILYIYLYIYMDVLLSIYIIYINIPLLYKKRTYIYLYIYI